MLPAVGPQATGLAGQCPRGHIDLAGRSGAGGGDGFEPAVDAKGSKKMADVVPYRLRAEVELRSNLLGRAALLQQP